MIRSLHGVISSFKAIVAPAFDLEGTMSFAGTTASNLSVSNTVSLRMETGDFTIEWYQFQTDTNSWPRIFSFGTYPSTNLGVSFEGGTFYVWDGGSARPMGSLGTYKNQWVHFALSRQSGTLRTFKDGVLLATRANTTTNYNSTLAMRIGNESTTSSGASFGGYLTNFRMVKGSALYTTAFDRPEQPLTAVSGTSLLLLASTNLTVTSDSSGLNQTVTNNNVTWASFSDPM
jgi:hypothetical protein